MQTIRMAGMLQLRHSFPCTSLDASAHKSVGEAMIELSLSASYLPVGLGPSFCSASFFPPAAFAGSAAAGAGPPRPGNSPAARARRPFPWPGFRLGRAQHPCVPEAAMSEPAITPELVAAHGIKPDEWQRLLDILGRQPSFTELGIFSAMWNEHCSYKSSKIHG
jgi:hypothetical protein